MTTTMRKLILRADACWLVLASLAGLAVAASGAFFASGPSVLRAVPEAGLHLLFAVAQLLATALPGRGRTTLLYPLELEESHP